MSESIRAVDRALDILTCFTKQVPRLTMTQIAEQVGMNKSTVHRLLGTLEKKRFVQRDPSTGLYQLGIRLFQMAYLTLEQSDLRRLSTPVMQSLCEKFRETITLSIIDDKDLIFLEVIESPQRVKLAASTGQRLPTLSTAAGKAMLAYMSKEKVLGFLEGGMQASTQYTITSKDVFMDNLDGARKQGFAISMQEYEDGINAVAAPILDSNNNPIAAITVAGPAYRLTKELMLNIGPSVVLAAQAIAQEINPSNNVEVPLQKGDR